MPSRIFVGGFGLEFGNDEVEQPVLRAVPRRPCSTVGAPPTPRRLNAARKATNVVRRPEARMLFFLPKRSLGFSSTLSGRSVGHGSSLVAIGLLPDICRVECVCGGQLRENRSPAWRAGMTARGFIPGWLIGGRGGSVKTQCAVNTGKKPFSFEHGLLARDRCHSARCEASCGGSCGPRKHRFPAE